MKRSILAISNHAAFIGGGEYSFFELLVHIQKSWQILSLVPKTAELAIKLRAQGIDTKTIPLAPLRPWYALNALARVIAHIRLCAQVRPALVYANGSRAAFYGGIAGSLLRLPVIWHCRIAERDPYLDTILCKLSSCIIANSHATATRFNPRFRHKIRVVYNGIDLQWLRDQSVEKPEFIRDEWKVILVVARVSRDKRHDVILSSFERAAKQDPNIHLICLGSKDSLDPVWWDMLQNRTQQSGSKERIHWIGQVEDVRPWYKAAYMLLLASENESFGRVPVEAMACGVPVIATRVGAIPETIQDGKNGILFTPGSASEACEAVFKLLRDDSLRNRISAEATIRAEEFSLERHVNQMVQVFEETLRHHARSFAR